MTEYRFGDKELTAIDGDIERNEYFEWAKEEYHKGRAYEMTFLPLAEGNKNLRFPLVRGEYGAKSQADRQAYSYIMQKTLGKTFEQGNPVHDSAVIVAMTKDDVNDYYKPNVSEWRSVTLNAIQEYKHKDPEWFGKLTPAAQLAAIGLEANVNKQSTPRLQYEDGLKLDFSSVPAKGYNDDLEMAADLVLRQAYQRIEHADYSISVRPTEGSRLSWEIKAAALEAQLKSHGNRGKIPSLQVFTDLMKTAETPAQQLKLAELSREPSFKDALRYGGEPIRNLAAAFSNVAARGTATQKLFYEVMYNFDLWGHLEPKLQYDNMNYQTLQAAKEEFQAQKSVDNANKEIERVYEESARLKQELRERGLSEREKTQIQQQITELQKKEPIDVMADLKLVIKHRPEFFERVSKLSPTMCKSVLREMGDRLPVQTQLEMMSKVVNNIAQGIEKGNGFNEHDYATLNNYISRATQINTSSRAMKQFMNTLEPVMDKAQTKYAEDKKYLANAAAAERERDEANGEWSFLKKTRVKYVELIKCVDDIKLMRDEIQAKEPSDVTLAEFMKDGIAGKRVNITYEPKKTMGLFMKNKDRQMMLREEVAQLNHMMSDAQASEITAEYLPKVTDETYNENIEAADQKFKEKDAVAQEFYLKEHCASNVAEFEKAGLAEKFAKLQDQYRQRSTKMRGQARTDLTMQFDGQEFNGKPMQGLGKEEEMAQRIYKRKIKELRQTIKDGVKQDMVEREVNKTPSKDNPNEAGKPMTKESTRKIRRNMKDLKEYQKLVRE